MKYFELNNGVSMPMLGMGVSQIGDATSNVVQDAIYAGYRAFDTAEFYGNEGGVGEGIRKSGVAREDFFITTKVHNAAQMTDHGPIKAFEQSLGKLGMDYIDLYLVHWPVPERFVKTYKTLEKIYQSGRARAIGVCNFKMHHLQALATEWDVPPAANQYEHHPYLTQPEIREYCQKMGILVTAYCPLGRGRLGLVNDDVITNIAAKHGKTAAQIILRWNMQLGVAAIPKTVTPSRMIENISIFDFELDAPDIAAINALDAGKRVIRDSDDPESY